MAAQQQQRAPMGLLDLGPDLLLQIAALVPFYERLRLPEVCTRLRDLLAGPSECWREVEAAVVCEPGEEWPPFVSTAPTAFQSFYRWLSARLEGVEILRLAVRAEPLGQKLVLLPCDLLRRAPGAGGSAALMRALGRGGAAPPVPLALTKLSVEWHGQGRFVLEMFLSAPLGPTLLPHLRKLSFPHGTVLEVAPVWASPNVPLTDFGHIDGRLVGDLHRPWLPPSLTMLALAAVGLEALPGVLAHLPNLRSLVLDHNAGLGGASLDRLTCLRGSLQELNLSECALAAFPRQISALSRLRILYLHNAFADSALLSSEDWASLDALRRLIFLSISGNALHRLPAAVARLSQLQGLHIEDNLITFIPSGSPVLGNLRELLMDWRTALGGPEALRGATSLTRLILNDHLAMELGAGPQHESVGGLLGALASLGALRRLDDVIPDGLHGLAAPFSAAVAHAMLRLGRALGPQVEIGTMPFTNTGWTLSALVAGLPHNDGLQLLEAVDTDAPDPEAGAGAGAAAEGGPAQPEEAAEAVAAAGAAAWDGLEAE